MSKNPDAKEFKAWLDKMPGANNTLHVKGTVTVPTSGWHATLTEAHPPGINPEILILEVKKVKPTGTVSQIVSHIPVHFDKPHSHDYKEVTIRGDGGDFTIKVTITE
jgi:hypothetical protein